MNEAVQGHDDTALVSILEASLAKWLRLHCVSFDGLLEADDLLSSFQSIKARVQLVLTDPQFNIRKCEGTKIRNAIGSVRSKWNILFPLLTCCCGQGAMLSLFSGLAQFSELETKFSGCVKENNADAVFQISKVPLILVSPPSSFGGNPFRRSCSFLGSSLEFNEGVSVPTFAEGRYHG